MDWKEGHVRDLLVAVAVVGGILLALFLYTGNWPPPVVVESNSMMHVEADEYDDNFGTTRAAGVPYGRLGTIDPGDLVLVKDTGDARNVKTFAHGDGEHYGLDGEVIVYFRFGDRAQTPIIHRAMTYVEVLGTSASPRYEVVWADTWAEQGDCRTEDGTRICAFGSEGITIEELQIRNRKFQWSGFITKGDNVVGNRAPDQVLGIMSEPVKPEWVQGVARGELPWFGLIKLMFTNPAFKNSEVRDHPYFWSIGKMTAPQDLWVMLFVGLALVAGAPVGIDYAVHRFRARGRPHDDERGDARAGPDHGSGGEGPGPPDDAAPSGDRLDAGHDQGETRGAGRPTSVRAGPPDDDRPDERPKASDADDRDDRDDPDSADTVRRRGPDKDRVDIEIE